MKKLKWLGEEISRICNIEQEGGIIDAPFLFLNLSEE